MAKTVLITGASGGIGAALARGFAQKGYMVALGYHKNEAAAQGLRRELEQAGTRAVAFAADVASSAQVEALFAAAERELGPVEVLVNNAGLAQQKLFCDISDDEWEAMMAVNAGGVFRCCRRALPGMIRRKQGCIINVSSMWGQVGASCEVHYSAAKAAVIGLTKGLAKEVGPSGVRVNCLAPGVIDTSMLEGFSAEDKAQLAEETPLGRLGTAQDVAAAALFLASEEASFITGQVLASNGGFVI